MEENEQKESNGLGVASLVLGILSIIFIFVVQWIGLILGIIGIVLAVNARKNNPSGVATAGLVLSIVGTVFCALGFIACAACVAAIGGTSTLI